MTKPNSHNVGERAAELAPIIDAKMHKGQDFRLDTIGEWIDSGWKLGHRSRQLLALAAIEILIKEGKVRKTTNEFVVGGAQKFRRTEGVINK